MEPFEIVGEISDYRSYQEYQKLNCTGDDETPIVQKMQRRILFNEQGIYENKMEITFKKCIRYCQEHNLKPTGEVFIGMLLLHGDKGKVQSYLEIRGW